MNRIFWKQLNNEIISKIMRNLRWKGKVNYQLFNFPTHLSLRLVTLCIVTLFSNISV